MGSVGRDHARALEDTLIPLGLVEPDPEGYAPTVYQLSLKAKRGEYIAVVEDSVVLDPRVKV